MTVIPFVSMAEPAMPVPAVVPAIDEGTGRLMLLLGELDAVGLAGELAQARALLRRAGEVVRAHSDGQAAVSAVRDQLIAAVADGSRGVADAACELAAADVRASAGDLMQAAVRALRGQAVAAVRADAPAVHDVLAGRVRAAVAVAVDAGRLLCDVKAFVRLLTPPPLRVPGPQSRPTVSRHPWVDDPPVLPDISLDTITGDRRKVVAWAESSAASQEIGRLFEATRALHALWGNSSSLWGTSVDPDVAHFVSRLTEPVQLAVADALGWKPGLHLSLKPGAPQTPRSWLKDIIAGVGYPPGGLAGLGNKPMDGPYGNGGRPLS